MQQAAVRQRWPAVMRFAPLLLPFLLIGLCHFLLSSTANDDNKGSYVTTVASGPAASPPQRFLRSHRAVTPVEVRRQVIAPLPKTAAAQLPAIPVIKLTAVAAGAAPTTSGSGGTAAPPQLQSALSKLGFADFGDGFAADATDIVGPEYNAGSAAAPEPAITAEETVAAERSPPASTSPPAIATSVPSSADAEVTDAELDAEVMALLAAHGDVDGTAPPDAALLQAAPPAAENADVDMRACLKEDGAQRPFTVDDFLASRPAR